MLKGPGSYINGYIWNQEKDGTDEHVCKTAMEMQTPDLWTRRGGEGEGGGARRD